MSILDHLDELRSRLLKSVIVYVVMFAVCWGFSSTILDVLMRPIRKHLFDGGEIVFIHLTEPFLIYMKASALAAVFVAAPFLLYQLWGFVSPGLNKRERRMAIPFMLFGSLFFAGGGLFGYSFAVPIAARWLIGLGQQFQANITLRSAFQFESVIILGMGLIFELPIVIFFLARVGLVTPGFLMKHFRTAVVVIVIISAIITPTGDVVTLSVFAGPMVLLYLLGVLVAWVFGKRGS